MAKTKTNERTVTADDRPSNLLVKGALVTDANIARRAYDLYLARGREHGHDVQDWLQAEREIRQSIVA
jgi:DUF2934 family protein